MIAKLNHMNCETPTDIANRVAAQLAPLEDQLADLESGDEWDSQEAEDLRGRIAPLHRTLNAANTLIHFLNAERDEVG